MSDLLADMDPETRGLADPDTSAHTDTCNGDHSDVSGRCGVDPEE